MLASRRSIRRVVVGFTVVATAFVAASCVEAPSGPQHIRDDAAAANPDLLGGLLGGVLNNLHLLSCSTQQTDSVTQVVGAAGGTINVGAHKLFIPSGALDHAVTITAVTRAVPRREVHFKPHGLVFEEKATLTMDYSGCSLVSQLLPKKIVYVDGNQNILELILSLDIFFTKKVAGKIEHFSAYAVAY